VGEKVFSPAVWFPGRAWGRGVGVRQGRFAQRFPWV